MRLFKYINYFFLFLLTLLLGVTTTHAKTELVFPQNKIVYSKSVGEKFVNAGDGFAIFDDFRQAANSDNKAIAEILENGNIKIIPEYEITTATAEQGSYIHKYTFKNVDIQLADGTVALKDLAIYEKNEEVVVYLAQAGGKSKIIGKLDALGNLTHAKNFVNSLDDVADASLLAKLDNLDDTQLQGLNTFYKNRQSPAGFSSTDYNFTATKVLLNGEQASVTYKYGFPQFHNTKYCPNFTFPNGVSGKFKYVNNNLKVTDYNKHFKWANEALLNKFGLSKSSPKNAQGFFEVGNYRWNGTTTFFELKNTTGGWDRYTWHHFEDGKTIIPVFSKAHQGNLGGFVHSGGNKILEGNFKGVFEFPTNY